MRDHVVDVSACEALDPPWEVQAQPPRNVLGQGADDHLIEQLGVPDRFDRPERVGIAENVLCLDPGFAEPVGGGAQAPPRRLPAAGWIGDFPAYGGQ